MNPYKFDGFIKISPIDTNDTRKIPSMEGEHHTSCSKSKTSVYTSMKKKRSEGSAVPYIRR